MKIPVIRDNCLSLFPKLSVVALCALPLPVLAEEQRQANNSINELTAMSLEELMKIDVTSIMKSTTHLSDVAAAVVVLTSNDIRRTGATTIPEALRVVPGMHVARIDGNKWSVSVRGFAGQFSDKLLVLIDGRSVYTPLYAGVWWDQQDVMMEDIDRIEVIRGPGASLWGANAVNGVINIITRSAHDTKGGLVSAHIGDKRDGAGLRYGTTIGEGAYLSMYGRYVSHNSSTTKATNQDNGDGGHLSKAGFRFDKTISAQDKLMLQGAAFDGRTGGAEQVSPNLTATGTPVMVAPFNVNRTTSQTLHGYHLLGRWERAQENDSRTTMQIYLDSGVRNELANITSSRVDTLDLDFQHNFHFTKQQQIIWGAGYRHNYSDSQNGTIVGFFPSQRNDDIYSAFIQDEITLVPDRWKLTVGSKLEHNPSTNYEVQPNARLLWTPDERNSFWASVSRSVRTPNWVDQNVSYRMLVVPPFPPANLPLLVVAQGNPEIKSEKLNAYELGWRGLVSSSVSTDVALYYYDYDQLTTVAPGVATIAGDSPQFFLLQPTSFTNFAGAQNYGGELSLNWQVMENWKLRANYSYFNSDFSLKSNAPAGTTINFDRGYPNNQAMLWSQHNLSESLLLDLNVRYVSDTGELQSPPGSYTAFDARLAWKPRRDIELALVGRNLLNNGQFEVGTNAFSIQTKNQREVFATMRIDF